MKVWPRRRPEKVPQPDTHPKKIQKKMIEMKDEPTMLLKNKEASDKLYTDGAVFLEGCYMSEIKGDDCFFATRITESRLPI
jgi:hypothetical protein